MYIKRYGKGSRSVYVGLHGWGGNHTTFEPLKAYLPDDCSLYGVDLPGYGRSPAPAHWSLSAIVEEMADLVMGLGAPGVTMMGNCSGAIFSLLAAQRIRREVERLVLIDPFAYMPWYFKLFLQGNSGRFAYYATFANPVGRWLTNQGLSSRRSAETNLTESFATLDHRTTHHYLRLLDSVGDIDRFRGLETPVDIAYGQRTFAAVRASVRMWKRVFPQARCVELRGAGHLPIEESSRELSRLIFMPDRHLVNVVDAP
jgi:pimeloyl-ACP methyl ester carboxylesterase